MDPLAVLLTWQFILFGLAVAAIMYVIRILVEYCMQLAKKDPKNSKLWTDVLLPILPVFMGAMGAMHFRTFPYPDGLVTKGDRFIFGLVAGLLSTIMYRMFKALIYQKIVGLAQNLQGNGPSSTVISVSNEQIPPEQISSRGQL